MSRSVRFQPDSDYFRVAGDVPVHVWNEETGKQDTRDETEMHAVRGVALWAEIGSGGWEEDGHWGGYLQVTRESGRPLIVEGKLLRFVEGATPGRFNIQNSTWD
ncbi:hypothetical protein [Streptomyces sp. NPDC048603]|uniref:hypothetical protein n=1 Tax=Streptomyces sp. NPDC048603 TaxID=3365577 RepID=UPI00371C0564